MGKIVVTEYISLDGVIETPGGGENYKHQGWTFDVEAEAEHPDKKPLRLVDSKSVGAGIAVLTYTR